MASAGISLLAAGTVCPDVGATGTSGTHGAGLNAGAAASQGTGSRVASVNVAAPTGPAADGQPSAPTDAVQEPQRRLSVVLVGDTGFNASLARVDASGGWRHGARTSWELATEGIRALINGDINFANLETVVTERTNLRAEIKAFVFATHPNAIRHLNGIGFNLFSLANNHGADYGRQGLLDTIGHLEQLGAESAGRRPIAHMGLGRDREQAIAPVVLAARESRVAFSAIGIGVGSRPHLQPGDDRPGQLNYRDDAAFAELVERLAGTDSDYQILSVHYGIERSVTPEADDIVRLRDIAVRTAGVDLVVGHHAHVARGVQEIDGRLILYGLGNFLHLGTADMSGMGTCRDFGLLVRVHLSGPPGQRLAARAIEVVALQGTHRMPRPMPPAEGRARVAVLNHLATGLDREDLGARGVRFHAMPDGSGLHCLPGAEQAGGRIAELCGSEGTEPAEIERDLMRRASASCGTSYVARREERGPERAATRRASLQLKSRREAGDLARMAFGRVGR